MRKIRTYAAAILLCVFLAISPTAFADYGNSTYGSCTYGDTCNTPSGSSSSGDSSASSSGAETVTTLPDGLEISVNLHNGQIIPRSGYLILVTPLNGRGETFKTASFSINNSSPATALPDETGTAQWQWLPLQLPGTHVTVAVVGQDGQTASENFTVKVAAANASAVGSSAGISAASGGIGAAVRRIFHALPRPVIYAFPYLLFILLAVDIALLLLQTSREMAELRTARRRLRRLQLMSEMKQTFTELVSHYLRTPLTLVSGGLEELGAPGAQLSAVASRLQQSVTALVDEARTEGATQPAKNSGRPFASPALWVPFGAAAALTALFDYLAQDAGGLSLGRIALCVQFAVLVLLGVGLYGVLRLVQLRRRDVRQMYQLVEHAERQLQAQERFVADALTTLRADFSRLSSGVSRLPANQAKVFIQDGVERLGQILDKLAIAVQMRGARSSAAYATLHANEVVANAWQPIAEEAEAKGVELAAPLADVAFSGQSAALVTLVCNHILDNAVAYSPAGAQVSVTATCEAGCFALHIADVGTGIAEDKLAWLLEPFAKGEGAETFDHEGMGFSLYLDKLILAYLGGTLTVASHHGKGTAVTIRLPQPAGVAQLQPRGTETSQMPWPSAANTAHAAPMVASDDVNS